MTTLSLREAAEQAGVSKSTIFRAITSGRMSAPRDDDRNFAIDPAELFRVYPPKPRKSEVAENVPEQPETQQKGQDAPPSETIELRIRNAELEAQLNALKQILETEKQRAEQDRLRSDQRTEELKAERDRWASALEASQRQITHLTDKQTEKRSGWWPFRRSA